MVFQKKYAKICQKEKQERSLTWTLSPIYSYNINFIKL